MFPGQPSANALLASTTLVVIGGRQLYHDNTVLAEKDFALVGRPVAIDAQQSMMRAASTDRS